MPKKGEKGTGTVRKHAVRDPQFRAKLLSACTDEWETGLVKVLCLTAMHVSCLKELSSKSIERQGEKTYITWRRKKTNLGLRFPISAHDVEDVRRFCEWPRKYTRNWYGTKIKDIGARAGFDNISPNSFRHTLCVNLIDAGINPAYVGEILGCSEEVVRKNYAMLKFEDYIDKLEKVNPEVVEGIPHDGAMK